MTSYQWIKLYDNILDDPKMGRLSDGAYRFCINILILAGRQENRDGSLPSLCDIAWTLRLSDEVAQSHLNELLRAGLVVSGESGIAVVGFQDKQGATDVAERMRQHRKRKQNGHGSVTANDTQHIEDGYAIVTESNADIDIDIDNTPLNPPVGGNGGAEPAFLRPGIVDPPIVSGSGRKNGHVNGFARRPPERIGVLIEAIRQVVKTTYDKDAIQDFEDAAYEVEGWGGTSESVAGFLPWWEQSEKYAGLPALKSFRAEYRNYLRGVKPTQGDTNGLAAAPGKLIIAADDEAGGYYG